MPVFDKVLEAGDLLYLPRGWWHDAFPMGETYHLAIGMHNVTVLHLMQWLGENVLHMDLDFRRSIRPGADNLEGIHDAAAKLVSAMTEPGLINCFAAAFARNIVEPSEPFAMERFGRPAALQAASESVECA